MFDAVVDNKDNVADRVDVKVYLDIDGDGGVDVL